MWSIYDKHLKSRFILGSSRYPSPQILQEAIVKSGTSLVTVSLRRQAPEQKGGAAFWDLIKSLNVAILPNTAGARTSKEAVATAMLARELFQTNWIKLEVIGDETNLAPDPFALVEAAEQLCKEGFCVFPYTTLDLILGRKLVEAGCQVLMPWASPIGSGQGICDENSFLVYRRRFPNQTVIVDAGIGKPSDAVRAMELGADAVLLNTAVALAANPVTMAESFGQAIVSGRTAFESGIMPPRDYAEPSTPTVGTPFWKNFS